MHVCTVLTGNYGPDFGHGAEKKRQVFLQIQLGFKGRPMLARSWNQFDPSKAEKKVHSDFASVEQEFKSRFQGGKKRGFHGKNPNWKAFDKHNPLTNVLIFRSYFEPFGRNCFCTLCKYYCSRNVSPKAFNDRQIGRKKQFKKRTNFSPFFLMTTLRTVTDI